MTINIDSKLWILIQDIYQCIQFYCSLTGQLRTSGYECYILGSEVHVFQTRTSTIGSRTGYLRATIFIISHAIIILIWNRATFVFGYTINIRAFVFRILDAIAILVRTSIEYFRTGNCRTSIIFISDTVTISIRATVEYFRSGYCRTSILIVRDTITICIFWSWWWWRRRRWRNYFHRLLHTFTQFKNIYTDTGKHEATIGTELVTVEQEATAVRQVTTGVMTTGCFI